MSMREVLEKADNVKPFASSNGIPVVTFDEQVALAEAAIYEQKPLPVQTLNADGTIARSRYTNVASTTKGYYINRYKAGRGKITVVTDYRAIQGQKSGVVYAKQIVGYVITREKTDDGKGALKLEEVVQISDAEFVADFTKTLNREAMEEILPLIYDVGDEHESDALPI